MRYNQFMQYLETRQQDNLLYFLHTQSNQGKDRLDKDWNFTKSWACPTFSRFLCYACKNHQKNIMVSASWWNLLDIFFIQGHPTTVSFKVHWKVFLGYPEYF